MRQRPSLPREPPELRSYVPRHIALYAMKVLGASHVELETAVRENSPKPVGVPIRNALILAAEPAALVEGFALAEVAENEGQEEYH